MLISAEFNKSCRQLAKYRDDDDYADEVKCPGKELLRGWGSVPTLPVKESNAVFPSGTSLYLKSKKTTNWDPAGRNSNSRLKWCPGLVIQTWKLEFVVVPISPWLHKEMRLSQAEFAQSEPMEVGDWVEYQYSHGAVLKCRKVRPIRRTVVRNERVWVRILSNF